MADFIFKVSPNIVLGSYSMSRLGQFAGEIGKKFMVILDPMLREVGIADKVTKSLDDHSIEYFVFEELSDGAATKTIEQALTLARQAHVHGVIGIGGNKVLNVSKAVCALYYESHDLYEFVEGAVPGVAPLPLICVPTTIRSPYLFSTFTPVVDSRSKSTKIIKSKNSICKLAVFDTGTFTVGGTPLESYTAAGGEAVSDGVFRESALRSAPYFDLRIDGITDLIH